MQRGQYKFYASYSPATLLIWSKAKHIQQELKIDISIWQVLGTYLHLRGTNSEIQTHNNTTLV